MSVYPGESFYSDFKQGLSYDCYNFFGSHVLDTSCDAHSHCKTVSFAVWAPHASAVRVCGSFNDWGGKAYPGCDMRLLQDNIWYTEIRGVNPGTLYRYQIYNKDGSSFARSDPFAFASEPRPGYASVVPDDNSFPWTDSVWLLRRKQTNYKNTPVNIYELHLGSWLQELHTYREIADALAVYLSDMNYTHVQLMPLCEYTHDGTYGYQTNNFYSVTSRYGSPEDFKYFVNRLHESGIGVILDWVPGSFSKEDHWLYRFDGTWTYEPEIENFRENLYLGTANFDFSKGEVRSFLISNAIYWLNEYHLDGLCVKSLEDVLYLDFENAHSVAPRNIYGGRENLHGVDFLRELNIATRKFSLNPIMIADDRSNWPMVTKPVYLGGLGFDFKWNIGWKNDSLEYMRSDPVYRSSLHGKMTYPISYAFSENYILPISHDDVRHGRRSLFDKMFGHDEEKCAALKAYLLYLMSYPGKKMLFMGSEYGETGEWNYCEGLNWHLLQNPNHDGLKEYVRTLNYIYKNEAALHEDDEHVEGFAWIDADNAAQNVYSFIRRGSNQDDFLLIICNFSDVHYPEYKIGVPRFADYQEILNSQDSRFHGTCDTQPLLHRPKPAPWNGLPFHIAVSLPAYSAYIYKPIFPKRVSISKTKCSELQKKE